MTPNRFSSHFRLALLAAAVSATTLLGACAPLIVGGAMVGTALSVTDRRTSGAQIEDQAIELKAIARLRETVPAEANVNVTSYNRTVLLTGEAPTEAARAASTAASTLAELPLVEMASSTSPRRPIARSCFANTNRYS